MASKEGQLKHMRPVKLYTKEKRRRWWVEEMDIWRPVLLRALPCGRLGHNTVVSGLQNGIVYTFRWTITAPGNCSPSKDEVVITVNRLTNGGATAGTATVCSA